MMNPGYTDPYDALSPTSTPSSAMSSPRPQHRIRTGSLPLKKRRLCGTGHAFSRPASHQAMTPYCPVPPSPYYTRPVVESSDEKIAALALVAAAASVAPLARSVSDVAPSDDDRATPVNLLQLRNDMKELVASATFDSTNSKLVTPEVVHPTKTLPTPPSPASPGVSGRRVHHPPLLTPLPNGCHGRTSRNNSYCRRTPCYNGSKYCKLHYQQYIVSGIRAPGEAPVHRQVEKPQPKAARTPSRLPTASGVTFQDRRFTGMNGERRCSAITTRGRECAHTSVNDTKYCFLHADYENNPPPRRGGATTTIVMTQEGRLSSDEDESSMKSTKRPLQFNSQDMPLRHTSPPSVSSEESNVSSLSTSSAHAVEERSIMSASKGSPYPMLSSISSDFWYERKVLITAGPLANHVGRVTKWGNGWVTVQIVTGPDRRTKPLLHNRRSVELVLLPKDEEQEESKAEANEQVVQPHDLEEAPCVRTVCKSEVQSSNLRKDGTAGACIESTAALQSMETSASDTQDGQKMKTLPEDLPSNANVPEEAGALGDAIVGMTEESKVVAVVSNSPEIGTVPLAKEETNTAKERSTAVAEQATSAASSIRASVSPTPTLQESEVQRSSTSENDDRLIELLAHEGRGRKHSLDLLFGTAALDRSRRKVHKPARYEDTAMLEKSKANRQYSEDGSDYPQASRKRGAVALP